MRKTFILLEILLICAQVINAQQSPCEKTFDKAKGLFAANNYSEAKVQFQKVVNNCDSNKEIAQEYIKLCDEWISVKDEGKTAIETNSRKINELNGEIANLKADVDEKAKTIRDADKIITDKEKALAEKTSVLEEKDLEIINLKEQNRKLLFYQEIEGKLLDSLKVLGSELNDYLQTVKWRNRRKTFANCDSTSDVSEMIEIMRSNIRLASSKKQKK